MQSENSSNNQEIPEQWLNLSNGRNPSEAQSRIPSKVYSCNFCMRKFFSSQALGGHQNAHKREGTVKHYQSKKMVPAMPVNNNSIYFKSLGVQPHSLVHKPGRDGTLVVERFTDTSTPFGKVWPRSFRLDSQHPEQQSSNFITLDLNLKL